MLVSDRMSHPVITIQPQATLEDANKLMEKEKISRLPVLDKKGNLVGIVSEKQIHRYMPSEATTLDMWEIRGVMNRILVEKVMTHEVVTVTPDTPIEEAARIMVENDISGIPVVSQGKLVGIIAETDLFKTFLEVLGARQPGIRVSVTMTDVPGQIVKLSQAIFNTGGNIISLGTFYGESGGNAEITIKVAGTTKEALTKALSPCVDKIIDIREVGVV
jgi:acetoin utilization protein AcuB